MQGTSHCIWPQRKMDALRPSSFCMQELLPHCLGEVADGSLSDAVLEVSVDAAKGKCLLVLFCVLLEGVVSESAVVTMIVFDSDASLACESLKRLLCLQCFSRCLRCHEMHVTQP